MRTVTSLREFSRPFVTDLEGGGGGGSGNRQGHIQGLLSGPMSGCFLDQFVAPYWPTLPRATSDHTWRGRGLGKEVPPAHARPGGRGRVSRRRARAVGPREARARGGGRRGAAHARPRSHFRARRGGAAGRPSNLSGGGGGRGSPSFASQVGPAAKRTSAGARVRGKQRGKAGSGLRRERGRRGAEEGGESGSGRGAALRARLEGEDAQCGRSHAEGL